jgi:hypothetical protein
MMFFEWGGRWYASHTDKHLETITQQARNLHNTPPTGCTSARVHVYVFVFFGASRESTQHDFEITQHDQTITQQDKTIAQHARKLHNTPPPVRAQGCTFRGVSVYENHFLGKPEITQQITQHAAGFARKIKSKMSEIAGLGFGGCTLRSGEISIWA